MLRAYIDYPVPRFMCHLNTDCYWFHKPETPEHRLVRINARTITRELQGFQHGDYRFSAEAGMNSLWLEVDFRDKDFELAVVGYVRTLLKARYTPFERTTVEIDCGL